MANSTVIKSMATVGVALLAFGTTVGEQQAQASTLFNDRTTFQSELDTYIVDDYENPNYKFVNNDSSMSNVLGETQYKSTGFSNVNIVYEATNSNHAYCAGCNGSFLLDFTATSVGNATGVFGAGFNILFSQNPPESRYSAYVTYGDDSTSDFSLEGLGGSFWGITSENRIKSIHIGLPGGGTTRAGSLAIDNLTIGSKSVPEPSSALGVLALGALSAGSMLKRKQQKKA